MSEATDASVAPYLPPPTQRIEDLLPAGVTDLDLDEFVVLTSDPLRRAPFRHPVDDLIPAEEQQP